MAELFCKICGGAIEVPAGATIVECSYCGYKQAVPQSERTQQEAEYVGKEVVEEKATETEDSYLKDGYEALKNRNLSGAHYNFSKVIEIDEENVSARIGNLLADLKCTCEEDLGKLGNTFENNKYYFELLKYADDATAERISNYNLVIFENQRKKIEAKNAANAVIAETRRKADIEEAQRRAAGERRKAKNRATIITTIVLLVAFVVAWIFVISPYLSYNNALELFDSGDYEAAYAAFDKLHKYKDSELKIMECSYNIARNNNDYPRLAMMLSRMDKSEADALYSEMVANGYTPELTYNTVVESGNALYLLQADGTVVAKGEGFSNVGKWTDIVGIYNGNHGDDLVGLRSNGTVVSVGSGYGIEVVKEWTDIVHIFDTDAGDVIGFKADGSICSIKADTSTHWDVSGWTDIVQVVSTANTTVGLRADGTVVSTGYYPAEVSEWTDIVRVFAGNSTVVGLKSDGTAICASFKYCNRYDLSEWSDIVQIDFAEESIFGLKSDGTVVAAGKNIEVFDFSGWTDIVNIACNGGYSRYTYVLGVKSDGTVVVAGNTEKENMPLPDMSGWSDIVNIKAGYQNAIGIKSDGTIVSVGDYDLEKACEDIKALIPYKPE